jgi:hypothetical protein
VSSRLAKGIYSEILPQKPKSYHFLRRNKIKIRFVAVSCRTTVLKSKKEKKPSKF